MKLLVNTRIGKKSFFQGRPMLIAEIGVNHECNIELAKKMIDQCVENNIPAVKFQAYKAGYIAAKNSPSYWNNSFEKIKSQRELFKKYDKFNSIHYEIIADYCYKNKIIFMCSVFDEVSLEYIDPLVDIHKISSSDINNLPLIEAISKKNKQIIMSCGASSLDEIEYALNFIKKFNSHNVIIMHCVLNYPTEMKEANLNAIQLLRKHFPKNFVGYSDHTMPDKSLEVLKIAHTLGAIAIEKHYTYDKNQKGNDHYHSFDYEDARNIMSDFKKLSIILGSSSKININNQLTARQNARRGIYVSKNIKKGQMLSKSNLITLRPLGKSIPASKWNMVLNKRARRNINKEEPLKYKDISFE